MPMNMKMDGDRVLLECNLCHQWFQFGLDIYKGRNIKTWDAQICDWCLAANREHLAGKSSRPNRASSGEGNPDHFESQRLVRHSPTIKCARNREANMRANLHGIHGKQYWTIKCENPQCSENLLLTELSPSADEEGAVRAKFRNENIRCDVCTQNTSIIQRQLFVLHIT